MFTLYTSKINPHSLYRTQYCAKRFETTSCSSSYYHMVMLHACAADDASMDGSSMVKPLSRWFKLWGHMAETLQKIEELDQHMGELRSSQIQCLASIHLLGCARTFFVWHVCGPLPLWAMEVWMSWYQCKTICTVHHMYIAYCNMKWFTDLIVYIYVYMASTVHAGMLVCQVFPS